MVDVSRGDIVTRGGLSFVVWVHGQGEIQAMPIVSGMADYRRLVTMKRDSAVATGKRLTAIDGLKSCREYYLHQADASLRPDGWDDARESDLVSFEDGRYHAPQPETPNCFWVQPTHSEY